MTKKKVLVITHDAGGSEIIAAYVKKNRTKHSFRVYTAGPGAQIFKRHGIPFSPIRDDRKTIRNIVRKHNDAAFALLPLAGWMTGIETTSLRESKRAGLRSVVYLEDWRKYKERLPVLPDETWAGDSAAFALAKKTFKGRPVRIRLVPNEFFGGVIRQYRALRKKKDSILFVSSAWGSETVLSDLLKLLSKHDIRARIRIRFHPADGRTRYDDILRPYRKIRIVKSNEKDITKDLAHARAVVGTQTVVLPLSALCKIPTFEIKIKGRSQRPGKAAAWAKNLKPAPTFPGVIAAKNIRSIFPTLARQLEARAYTPAMTICCILCGSSKKSVVRTKVRYGVRRKVFKCGACGMVYLEPASNRKKYYSSKEYRKKFGPVLGKASNPKQVFDMYFPYQAEIIDQLKGVLRKDMKVLDVGCSAGQFLTALKGKVKKRIGMELSREDVAFIRKNLDFKVYDTPIESTDIKEGPFDLVTALQVLEHVERPVEFLKGLGKNLKRGGYLYLELPNLDDVLVSTYKVPGYIDFYYREPHLSYFTKKTLARALKAAGFKGKIGTVQRYSLFNHIHWIQNGKPQPNYRAGANTPKFSSSKQLNAFMEKTDSEYKKLIGQLGLGESLTFLGRKT